MSCSRRCDCRTARPRDLRPRRAVRVGQAHLQPGADGGQRAAQLVGGVGDEAALPGRRVLQPGQHVVHRAGQAADLVVGAGLRHALGQVGAGDRGDGTADLLHRPQRAPDHQPHRAAGQHQQDRYADHQQPGERLVDLALQVGTGDGDDGDQPAAGRDVLAVDGQIAGQPGAVRGGLPDRRGGARRERVERAAGRPGSAWRPARYRPRPAPAPGRPVPGTRRAASGGRCRRPRTARSGWRRCAAGLVSCCRRISAAASTSPPVPAPPPR